jgi:predicted MFS family arabinose efflux permease
MNERRLIIIFSLALICFAFGSAINSSIFNNYLVDEFDFSAEQRGGLEIPRELPGLLVTFTIALFFFVSELRLLSLACAVAALGLFGLGEWTPNGSAMIWWVFLGSMGIHVQMVLIERVSLEVGLGAGTGHRLGRMNGLRSLGMIVGALFIALLSKPLHLQYNQMFIIGGMAMMIGAALYFFLSNQTGNKHVKRSAFVFKKRYMRYFVLSGLFGIRKQIFITFAPWFLVRILALRPEHIARILMVSAALGIIVKPWLGKMIDVWGERRVLVIDGMVIAFLCLGYVVFPMIFSGSILVMACAFFFILDELLFTLRTARTTWLAKIAEIPEDVTGAMSLSVSLDHVLSMSVSLIAGFIWIRFGYQMVFVLCTLVAVTMSIVSAGIRSPKPAGK